MSFIWKIKGVKALGERKVVVAAVWECEHPFSAKKAVDEAQIRVESSNLIDYDKLTENDVLEMVWKNIDKNKVEQWVYSGSFVSEPLPWKE